MKKTLIKTGIVIAIILGLMAMMGNKKEEAGVGGPQKPSKVTIDDLILEVDTLLSTSTSTKEAILYGKDVTLLDYEVYLTNLKKYMELQKSLDPILQDDLVTKLQSYLDTTSLKTDRVVRHGGVEDPDELAL